MHRRKAFRPRAIDIDRPMAIVRHEIDNNDMRSVPELDTGMDHEEEEEVHLQQALRGGKVAGRVKKAVTIPTPSVMTVKDYDTLYTSAFELSRSYVQHTPLPSFTKIDYDLDSEDDEELDALRAQGLAIDEDAMEYILDRLEKEQGWNQETWVTEEQLQVKMHAAPKEVPADVCKRVYEYWKSRRKRMGHPIMVHLRKPPEYDNPSPYIAFRPREKDNKKRHARTSDAFCLEKLHQLRAELYQARDLLDLVCQREEVKRERIVTSQEIFSLRCKEEHDRQVSGSTSGRTREKAVKEKRSSTGTKSQRTASRAAANDDQTDILALNEIVLDRPATKRKRTDPGQCFTDGPLFDPYPPHAHNYRWLDTRRTPSEASWKVVKCGKGTSFRGRARIGRGGRVIVDRMPV